MSGRAAPRALPGLVLGGEPRVNLIPPEVGERARRRRTRGFLVAAIVVVTALVVAGYAVATIRAIAVQQQLAAAQARTQTLLEQRAQYADTAAAARAVSVVQQTRLQATSGEVLWADVFDEITAELGPNTYVEWSADSPPPWVAPLEAAGALGKPRVGVITLSVRSAGPLDSTALFTRLRALDITADMSYQVIELPTGETTYLTTITLNLAAESLALRFAEGGDQESTEEADDEGK